MLPDALRQGVAVSVNTTLFRRVVLFQKVSSGLGWCGIARSGGLQGTQGGWSGRRLGACREWGILAACCKQVGHGLSSDGQCKICQHPSGAATQTCPYWRRSSASDFRCRAQIQDPLDRAQFAAALLPRLRTACFPKDEVRAAFGGPGNRDK